MNAMHLNAVSGPSVVDETDLHSCTCKSWYWQRLCSLCFITVFQTFCEGPNNSGPSLAKFHEGPDPRTLAGSTPMFLANADDKNN